MSRGRDRDDVEDLHARTGSIPDQGDARDTQQPDRRTGREREDRSGREDSRSDALGRGGSSRRKEGPSRTSDTRRQRELPPFGNRRTAVARGDRTYRLRETEIRALQEIGTFRAVKEEDLLKYRYAGEATRMDQDLRSLARQGLVERRQIAFREGGEVYPAVALTVEGKRLAEEQSAIGDEGRQEFHAGFVKPAELAHDLALYRVYQAERDRIEAEGGAVDRVVLDYELKRDVYSALGAQDASDDERFAELQQQAAEQHNLRVVDGKIPLPDLRIEFRDAAGASARVDVELTTEHYKSGQVAAKAQAGFSIYTLAGDGSSGGTPVRDEREITAGILSV